MPNIEVISSSESLYSLKDEWNNLLVNSKSNNIFLRWEWHYHWWQVYGADRNSLYIIAVREGDKLIGIAPFYIENKYLSLIREVRFIGSNIVCSDYLDFILYEEMEDEIIKLIVSYLKANKHLWDYLNLTDICSASKNLHLMENNFRENKIRIRREYTVCPYVNLSSDWLSIYDSFDSILKNIIKRMNNKIIKKNIKLVEVGKDEDLTTYLIEFLRLNKLRNKQKGIRSPFLDSNFMSFHKAVITELHKNELVKFYFLKAGDVFISALYLFDYNNKYYYYQSGYDPSWGRYSPGTLLFYYCIKTAHERGINEFDFLQGRESFKSLWTKNKRTNVNFIVYNDTFKSNLLGIRLK